MIHVRTTDRAARLDLTRHIDHSSNQSAQDALGSECADFGRCQRQPEPVAKTMIKTMSTHPECRDPGLVGPIEALDLAPVRTIRYRAWNDPGGQGGS